MKQIKDLIEIQAQRKLLIKKQRREKVHDRYLYEDTLRRSFFLHLIRIYC